MTDKLLIDRAVVEQALEALEMMGVPSPLVFLSDEIKLWQTVQVELRAALEQPQVEQGPVSKSDNYLNGYCAGRTDLLKELQDTDEPVAWAVMQGGVICWEADYPFSNEPGWCDSDQQSVPLYTHPQPPRQPLTDDQIAELMMEAWGCASIAPRHAPAFARAVEAAHGIKERK